MTYWWFSRCDWNMHDFAGRDLDETDAKWQYQLIHTMKISWTLCSVLDVVLRSKPTVELQRDVLFGIERLQKRQQRTLILSGVRLGFLPIAGCRVSPKEANEIMNCIMNYSFGFGKFRNFSQIVAKTFCKSRQISIFFHFVKIVAKIRLTFINIEYSHGNIC